MQRIMLKFAAYINLLSNMRILKLVPAAVALLLAMPAFAQAGSDAMPFARIDRNPATAGTAFAGTASASDIAWSSFSNSAVIPFYDKTFDVAASVQLWAPDGAKSTNIGAGAGYKVNDRIGFSLGFVSQGFESYDIINDVGVKTGSFTPKAIVVNGGFGVRFSDAVSAGANLRYLSQSVTSATTLDAFAADVLVYYKPVPEAGLTAGIVSVGSSVKSVDGKTYDLPASAKLAGDYTFKSQENAIKLVVDLDYFFAGNFAAAGGLQYCYNDIFFLRGGYHYGKKDAVLPSFATVGAGFKFAGVKVDVAWLTANKDLGNSLTIGLGYTF